MNPIPLKTWAVLTAGGHSQRFQADAESQGMTLPANKLLSLLDAQPVLAHSLRALLGSMPFEGIVVTASSSAMLDFQVILKALQAAFPHTPLFLVEGGGNRRASVYAGLTHVKALAGDPPDVVVIHDGARPLLPLDFLPVAMQHIAASADRNGIIAGHPMRDTIKRASVKDHSVLIESTVARDALWAVQTPQVFRWQALWDAHQAVPLDASITDDAELIERHLGMKSGLCLLPCSQRNLKITTPEDLALARFWLNR